MDRNKAPVVPRHPPLTHATLPAASRFARHTLATAEPLIPTRASGTRQIARILLPAIGFLRNPSKKGTRQVAATLMSPASVSSPVTQPPQKRTLTLTFPTCTGGSLPSTTTAGSASTPEGNSPTTIPCCLGLQLGGKSSRRRMLPSLTLASTLDSSLT